MRAVDFERVAISVHRRWPNLDETQLFLRELRALEERATRLRGWAQHLLAIVIPSKVRRELLKGHHLITGRNSVGERVPLTIDDLVGLNIDLSLNRLVGPTTAYTDVSVRPALTASDNGHAGSSLYTDTPVVVEVRPQVPTAPIVGTKPKKKARAQWIEEAFRELSQEGLLQNTRPGERYHLICKHIIKKGGVAPSERYVRAFFNKSE
jgi:hypothetical protein